MSPIPVLGVVGALLVPLVAADTEPAVARREARERAGRQEWSFRGQVAGPVRSDEWWVLENLTNRRQALKPRGVAVLG